jgi:hypothetical protein
MRGAATRTNFPQLVAVEHGVSPLQAEPSGQVVLRHPSGAQVCDWKGKGALPLGGFGSPGIQHDDFSVDLRAAEWQQVDNGNLLKGISSDVSLICRCLFFGLYCMPYDCV